MQVQTKANVYNVINNSFKGQDGQMVESFRVELGCFGEKAISVGIDKDMYNHMAKDMTEPLLNVPVTLDLQQYGNRVGVRCIKIG